MSLVVGGIEGWKKNLIGCKKPFTVELIGPDRLPQVTDASGICALSGPNGDVFCKDIEQANTLCELANKDQLEKDIMLTP